MIEKYLQNIQAYEPSYAYQTLGDFEYHLSKVDKADEKFRQMALKNQHWMYLSNKTLDDFGFFHIYYYIYYNYTSSIKYDNELAIEIYDDVLPVIVVTVTY